MKRASGFTIIELVVTIAIAAILLGLATPAMQTYLANQRVTAAMNTVTSALALARSTAVERRQATGLCPSADGSNCGSSADWGRGWLVWVDRDLSGAYSAGDELVKVNQQADGGLTVTANVATLVYAPSGLLVPMPGNAETITICKNGASRQAVIQVLPSGQVVTRREASQC